MRTLRIVLCTFLFAVPALAQQSDSAPVAKPTLKARSAHTMIVVMDATREGPANPTRKWELMQLNF